MVVVYLYCFDPAEVYVSIRLARHLVLFLVSGFYFRFASHVSMAAIDDGLRR